MQAWRHHLLLRPDVAGEETGIGRAEEDGGIEIEVAVSLAPQNNLLPSFERIDSVDENLRNHPCFLFITRPDLYNYAKVCVQHVCVSVHT